MERYRRGARSAIFVLCVSLGCVQVFALGGLAVWLTTVTDDGARVSWQRVFPPVLPTELKESAASALAKFSSSPRASRVYPYSIIPGGIENVEQLRDAAAHDPVVAAHYAGFDFANARMIRAHSAREAYVSYRSGANTYWTTQKLKIDAGELLITDGSRTARARCGNLISKIPASPVYLGEPTASVLDTPLESTDPLGPATAITLVPRQSVDSADRGTRVFVPVFPLFPADPPAGPLPPSPVPTPVPEPATMTLLLIGLSGIWIIRKR